MTGNRTPVPGSLWRDAAGRLHVAVVVDGDAGGGLAYLKIFPFHPLAPEMLPAWSWRAEEMRPAVFGIADDPTAVQPALTDRPIPLPRRT